MKIYFLNLKKQIQKLKSTYVNSALCKTFLYVKTNFIIECIVIKITLQFYTVVM